MISLDTPFKRIWLTLSLIWFLFSLLVVFDFTYDIFGADGFVDIVVSVIVLSSAPILPLIATWINDLPSIRRTVWGFAVLAWVVLLLVIANAPYVPIFSIYVVLAWGIVVNTAFLLHGKLRSGHSKTIAVDSSEKLKRTRAKEIGICLFGIVTAIATYFAGVLGGVFSNINAASQYGGASPSVVLGGLIGLNVWYVIWYHWRKGKQQFYRWRNLIYVLLVSNWIGICIGLAFDPFYGVLAGPVVLIIGIFKLVLPRPVELSPKITISPNLSEY